MRFEFVSEDVLDVVLEVELDAFDGDESIRTLVTDLSVDPSAHPDLSLLAFDGANPVGHVLLTRAALKEAPDVRCMILAPLAVKKSHQKQGVGRALCRRALDRAREQGVELVFVLGYPDYYPRAGFEPAFPLGFSAPYPIPEKNEPAWMVQELSEGAIIRAGGGVASCPEAMMKPEYWRE